MSGKIQTRVACGCKIVFGYIFVIFYVSATQYVKFVLGKTSSLKTRCISTTGELLRNPQLTTHSTVPFGVQHSHALYFQWL